MNAFARRCLPVLALLAATLPAARTQGQVPATTGIFEYRHALPAAGFFRIWNPTGAVRVTTWEQDSVVVTGKVAAGAVVHCGAGGTGAKCFVSAGSTDDPASAPADLDVVVPRLASIWVKAVGADITITAAGGNLEAYSVTGAIRVGGRARTVQAESMGGPLDIAASVESLRARSGEGTITLSGSAEDVDVSSVTGAIQVRGSMQRGRLESIDGPLQWRGAPPPDAQIDLISHKGRIEVRLPGGSGGVFAVSSYKGSIACSGRGVRQVALEGGRDVSCTLPPDRNARFTIRNFKGPVFIARE